MRFRILKITFCFLSRKYTCVQRVEIDNAFEVILVCHFLHREIKDCFDMTLKRNYIQNMFAIFFMYAIHKKIFFAIS